MLSGFASSSFLSSDVDYQCNKNFRKPKYICIFLIIGTISLMLSILIGGNCETSKSGTVQSQVLLGVNNNYGTHRTQTKGLSYYCFVQ